MERIAMKLVRRKFLHLAAGAAALPAISRVATAQTYPSRPITMIVPFAAGGAGDSLARIVVERMRASLGQSIVIENVTGAEGSIGIGRAVRARPDGYTICLGTTGTHVLNSVLYSLSYDTLNDFVPIAPLAMSPLVLYSKRTIPAKNLAELITWSKVNANKVSAGNIAGSFRLMTMLFQRETSTNLTLVPYRGGPPAVQDLVAGQLDVLIATSLYLPLVRSGSIKAYAVTSDTRLVGAPEIPTFKESGLPLLSYFEWASLFAPKGTPGDPIGKLDKAVMEALADPAVLLRLADFQFEAFPREKQTPEALTAMQKADAQKWLPLMREFGIKAE
jgi:tripartite-type tricarboxylate transporter receptor subunit TctC